MVQIRHDCECSTCPGNIHVAKGSFGGSLCLCRCHKDKPSPSPSKGCPGSHVGEKCSVCNWPMTASAKDGCVPGDCSMRPVPAPKEKEDSNVSDKAWNLYQEIRISHPEDALRILTKALRPSKQESEAVEALENLCNVITERQSQIYLYHPTISGAVKLGWEALEKVRGGKP